MDHTDYAQESVDVVIPALILPQAAEDEEKLDENYCKGNQARTKNGIIAFHIPCRLGNLSWNATRLGWMIPWPATVEAKPAASVDEGYLDEQPKCGKTDKGAERKSSA